MFSVFCIELYGTMSRDQQLKNLISQTSAEMYHNLHLQCNLPAFTTHDEIISVTKKMLSRLKCFSTFLYQHLKIMKKIIKKEIIIKKTKRHGFTCWLTYNLYIDIKANTDKNELLTVQMFHEAAVSYHILITLLW